MTPLQASFAMCGIWGISWLAVAFWSKRTTAHAAFGAEAAYRAVIIVGAGLLFVTTGRGALQGAIGWIFAAVVSAGFAFCWWARIYLGAMWSANVVRKQGHHIVESGPYGLVRHPIYTGLIVAALGLAVIEDTPRAFLGLGIFSVGYFLKASLEERFLSQELGPEAYDGYRRRVPMLIPWKLGLKGG